MKNKLDPICLEGIRRFSKVTSDIGIEFIIIGAAARDLILFHQYGIETRRRTEDIDFAVMIDNWKFFELLRTNLLKKTDFTEAKEYHRVVFQKQFPIDFIPFGDIEDKDGKVKLPPDFVFELDMTGFREVFENSIQLKLDNNLIINITSLTGLAILKIFAWKNRIRNDVFDLSIIIENYIDAGNKERFFENYSGIVANNNFDYVNASAWLLGSDINITFSKKLKEAIIDIITTEDKDGHNKLAIDLSINNIGSNDSYEENLNIVNNLIKGINDENPVF